MSKKILNKNIDNSVKEMLSGYVYAYNRYYKKPIDGNSIIYKGHRKDKVAIVIGGGSGHEPLFIGYCGAGLADAVACGNICASPNPKLIFDTAKEVDQGRGVLFIYGCYAGDNLNFDMAEYLCNSVGIETKNVRVQDDFSSAPKERKYDRRGIAGDVFVIKIAGAAADVGESLEEVHRITSKARDNVSTIGLATSPATLPGNDKPTFELEDDEMEYGMGLHGEPGIERTKLVDAETIVNRMYSEIKKEMDLKKGDEICVLINGLGSTPLFELNIVYYNLYRLMHKDGLKVHDADIGSYCTCMEMGGFSISVLRIDEELKKYYDMPCFSPYYAKGSYINQITESDDSENFFEVKNENVENESIERSKSGILETLNVSDTKNMLLYIANKIISNKPYLTEVDSKIGDGDHGIGMALGMEKVKKVLHRLNGVDSVYKLFEEAGNAMLMSMGGASGVIFGSMYLAGAKDMASKASLTAFDLADMEEKSLNSVVEIGHAGLGDKTMVDALYPVVIAMKNNADKGLLEMLLAAEEAAKTGVENTKKYVAKFGRAKSLGERAVGFQDAGATSVYLIIQGMREFVEGKLEV